MKLGIGKQFILVFIGAAALYGASYSFIEHLRVRKGGWQVTFSADAAGQPLVTVSQPVLNITNVQLQFPGEIVSTSNLPRTIVFNAPITNTPFGGVIFIDTTFQPGTIVFDFFGHEVQLFPRSLGVNRREMSWSSASIIQLTSAERPPPDLLRRGRSQHAR